MERTNITTKFPWENAVASSRAVKIGNYIHISGTTAIDEQGKLIGLGDPYRQTKQIIRNIESALNMAGADLENIVRTRIYLINIDSWKAVGQAHAEFFEDIRPATSMIEVSRLISREMLVEMEADAIIS